MPDALGNTTDLDVEHAVRWTILHDVTPCPVPTATLSATIAPGVTSIPVTSGGLAFNQGQILYFDDLAGERRLTIGANSTATAIPLDPTFLAALGQSGTAQTHTSGTLVYTNLNTGRAIDTGAWLATGWPSIDVIVKRQEASARFMPAGYISVFAVSILWSQRLIPPTGSAIDTNTWALEMQESAKTILQQIEFALLQNPRLLSDRPAITLDLGQPGSSAPRIVKDWTRLTGMVDVLEFQAETTVLFSAAAGYR